MPVETFHICTGVAEIWFCPILLKPSNLKNKNGKGINRSSKRWISDEMPWSAQASDPGAAHFPASPSLKRSGELLLVYLDLILSLYIAVDMARYWLSGQSRKKLVFKISNITMVFAHANWPFGHLTLQHKNASFRVQMGRAAAFAGAIRYVCWSQHRELEAGLKEKPPNVWCCHTISILGHSNLFLNDKMITECKANSAYSHILFLT